jgi:hypothetical protein
METLPGKEVLPTCEEIKKIRGEMKIPLRGTRIEERKKAKGGG